MDLGLEALSGASANGRDDHRPEFFRLASPGTEVRLHGLLKQTPGIQVLDTLRAQLGELMRALSPAVRFTPELLEDAIVKHLAGRDIRTYGVWVYYPWSRKLVHLLDEEEFALVRTDRNRNKITREEQQRLARLKVGVIGLSVGQSVSMTMALERSFGEIRLADFDQLDLSNLNRIRTGTQHLGLNKAVIVAREIAELDPFLKVTCFTEGLTRDNIDAFFTEGGRLDVVVEECDSVDIKILARQKAKALGIPVVMDTSDRGCLDVERFDLEPGRSIMHGWIDHLDLEAAGRPMTAEEKVPYISPISGLETLSTRMKASLIELGQSVTTWPQLATSVVLGGALAGDAVRRIALDQFHASGRWFIDLDELIADPASPEPVEHPEWPPLEVTPKVLAKVDAALGTHKEAVELDRPRLHALVEAGGLAPSAGNMQPWRFCWHERRLLLFHDPARSGSYFDPDHRIAHIALGACVENVVLKAHALGLEVRTDLAPLPSFAPLMAAFTFSESPGQEGEPHTHDALAGMIGVRCTNRKVAVPVPFPSGSADALKTAAADAGVQADILHDPAALAEVAAICGAAERIRVMNPIGHREFFGHELRWNAREVERTRDGLDIATLEVSPMDAVGLRVAADPQAMALAYAWNGGRGLERLADRSIRGSSAVALISITADGIADRLRGGRAAERLWMAANAAGWSVHPISAPIFLTHILPFSLDGLRDRERAELSALRERLRAVWSLPDDRQPLFMVRLSQAGQPSVRSLRRPVASLLLRPEPQTL